MKTLIPLLFSSALVAPTLTAQTLPCVSMNDSTTVVSNIISSFGFAGPWTWAVKYTPASNLVVRGMRIYTGNTFIDGFMQLEVWSHDQAADLPDKRLTGGTWKNPKSPIAWVGTDFDKVQVLQQNTPYWLVWVEPGWSTIPIEAGGTALKMANRAGTSAFASSSSWELKFRLYCSPLDGPGININGAGCDSTTGQRGMAFTNTEPNVGNQDFRIEGTGFPADAKAFLALGTTSNWPSVTLGNLAPGCFQNTDIQLFVTGKTGTGDVRSKTGALGHVSFDLAIPNTASLKGVFVGTQIAVEDKNAKHAVPLVFSNGLQITIQ